MHIAVKINNFTKTQLIYAHNTYKNKNPQIFNFSVTLIPKYINIFIII